MIDVEKKRNQRMDALKTEYQISDGTRITVGSHHILGQFSLLNRHREGNEQRIEKLKNIINETGDGSKFAHAIGMKFEELMEVYDVSKNIDMESVEEILRKQKNDLSNSFQSDRIECTSILEPIDVLSEVSIGQIYFEVGGRKIPLKIDGVYDIGRELDNAIWIDEATVSRKHARLTLKDERIFLEDLNSSNGTYLNDIRIGKKELVEEGSIIKVGRTNCVLRRNI